MIICYVVLHASIVACRVMVCFTVSHQARGCCNNIFMLACVMRVNAAKVLVRLCLCADA
jgi:hypothetical protein